MDYCAHVHAGVIKREKHGFNRTAKNSRNNKKNKKIENKNKRKINNNLAGSAMQGSQTKREDATKFGKKTTAIKSIQTITTLNITPKRYSNGAGRK